MQKLVQQKRRKTMTNRIDFQVIFTVEHANPNGDPIDGNNLCEFIGWNYDI